MIRQSDKILADELVKNRLIEQKDIETCIAEVKGLDESLRQYLVRLGFVTEEQVVEALAKGLQLETIDLKNLNVEQSIIDRIPVKFASYYKILPIKIDHKTLTIAASSSLDVKIQDEIRLHLGLEPKVVLAKEEEVIEALRRHYGIGAETIDQIAQETKDAAEENAIDESVWVEDLEKDAQDASVAKLVNQIFLDAYQKRATDIHIEPYREKVRLRYRVDGVLRDANLPAEARHFLRPMLSRIKIMANLSIEEKRLPQDGTAIVKTKDQDLDLRISTIPTPRGESMVIRILPTKVMLYSLDKLGIQRDTVRILKELIKKPHGIILVTGPTGSGKTTTLYASLNEINAIEKKVITIEDPIEFEMEGITQIQVNNKVNFDFARGLRSILRHDPDIIMVGEVRDLETAEIAIRTALTGHLVFSTLHTNDAASGISRLVDMGVEPFLVASSVEAFIAQRLVRTICKHCKKEITSPMLELREEISGSLGIKKEKVKLFHGEGCDRCNDTGFLGRTAIYEVLIINEDIRQAILEKGRPDDIKDIAVKNRMRTLRQDGWLKVVEGITTAEEVMEITVKDNFVAETEEGTKATPSIPVSQKKSQKAVKVIPDSQKNDYDSRVYPRLETKLDVRFEFMRKDEETNEYITDGVERATYTVDISAGGLRFSFGQTIAAGTILALKLQLTSKERSIDCLAKVCRVEEDNVAGRFNIIAYFLDIPSADRVKVSSYVEEMLKKKKSK